MRGMRMSPKRMECLPLRSGILALLCLLWLLPQVRRFPQIKAGCQGFLLVAGGDVVPAGWMDRLVDRQAPDVRLR